MELEQRITIIDAYATALNSAGSIIGREADLPCSKDVISEVLLEEMKGNHDADVQAILEEGFLRLELFLPDDDFEMLGKYLEYIGELADFDGDFEEIFQKAAEKVPTTNDDVQALMEDIEQRLIERKAVMAAL